MIKKWRLAAILSIGLASAFGQTATQPLRVDATGNVLPLQVNGHPLNLPIGTELNTVPLGGGGGGGASIPATTNLIKGDGAGNGAASGLTGTILGTGFSLGGGTTPETLTVTGTMTLTGMGTLDISGGGVLGSNAFTSTPFVLQTTTVNGHALSSNVTVTPADLGATTVGTNLLTNANPSAIRFIKINADNTVTYETAATFRSDIGAGSSGFSGLFTDLDFTASNLNAILTRNFSDLQSKPTTLSGYGITDGVVNTTTVNGHALSSNVTVTPTDLSLVIGTNVQAFDADLTSLAAATGTNTIYYRSATNTWSPVTIGSGLSFSAGTLANTGSGGTVTTFSAGTLSPLFTTGVTNPGTTPALSFTLSTVAGHRFFGNNTGSTTTPSYVQPAFADLSGTLTASQLPTPTASTLGGIESFAPITHQWINAISTSGIPASTQPGYLDLAFTDSDLTVSTTSPTLTFAWGQGYHGDITASAGTATYVFTGSPATGGPAIYGTLYFNQPTTVTMPTSIVYLSTDTNSTPIATRTYGIGRVSFKFTDVGGKYILEDDQVDYSNVLLVSNNFSELVTAGTQATALGNLGGISVAGGLDLGAFLSGGGITGTLPVANGGTGDTTLTSHGVLLGSGTSPVSVTGTGTTGQVLTSNGTLADPTFQTVTGGTGTPAGATTNVQYNNAGAFAGDANFTWNSGTVTLGVGTGVDGQVGTFAPAAISTAQNGANFTVRAGNGVAGTTTATHASGGNVTITAGDAAHNASGTDNGGSLTLRAGALIGSGTNGLINFTIGPNLQWKIFGNGNLANFASPTPPTDFTVGDTGSATPRGIMEWQASADTNSARLTTRKSRGTFASPAAVLSGDVLGHWVTTGYDGASYLEMGGIRITADGTVASTRVPTKMEFLTGTDAAPSVATVALTLNKDQTAVFAQPIAVASGGTGLAALTAHDVLIGEGTSAVTPITPGTSGWVLTSNGTGSDPSFQAAVGGTPGGSATQFQYNSGGTAFAGNANAILSVSGSNPTFTDVVLKQASNSSGKSVIYGKRITDTSPVGHLEFLTQSDGTTGLWDVGIDGTLNTGIIPAARLSGLGTGVGTFLATPSSANLAAALTDETGTGAAVFGTSPTLVTPALGTPASGVLTNCTGLPLTTGITGVLALANFDTSSSTANHVLMSGASAAPTWSTPAYPTAAGTSGNVLTSDGTNWLSSTPTGGAHAVYAGASPPTTDVGFFTVQVGSISIGTGFSATDTAIFTVPTGRIFVCTGAELVVTSVTGAASGAVTWLMSSGAGATNKLTAAVASGATIPAIGSVYVSLPSTTSGPFFSVAASSVVNCHLTTANTSTTCVATCFVHGYYSQ